MELWLLLMGVYTLLLLFTTGVWRKIKPLTVTQPFAPAVTVLIPSRNEASRLPKLLDDLVAQDYPGTWEILVLDDHSDDDTATLARQYEGILPITVLSLGDIPTAGSGKKAALSLGVAQARGDVIVTTDADCRVGHDWLVSLVQPLVADEKVQLSFGPVTYFMEGFWSRVQALELWSLIGIGGVLWKLGAPSLCNGANLAFRKQAFQAVGGYGESARIPSGDDEFLLHALREHFGSSAVHFQKDPRTLVRTAASTSVRAFYQQRTRWASKWNMHRTRGPQLTAVGVFAFHAVVLLGVVAVLWGRMSWVALALGLGMKALGESVFLSTFARTYRLGWPWLGFALWQGIYSLYALSIGLAVQRGSYQWKGRTYER